MIYQLKAVLFFETEDPIDDIYDKIRDHFYDAVVVNPGMPNQECSTVDIIRCHHDDHPAEACELNEHVHNCPSPPP